MNKTDLINIISRKRRHMTKKEVEQAVNCILERITEALMSKERIEIRNFGVFSVHYRISRKGRNFVSGESLHVPPRYVTHFKVGKELRQRVAASIQKCKAG